MSSAAVFLTSSCEVELILDDLEKLHRVFFGRLVISCHTEDLAHAEIHAALAGADIPDALEEFIEVVGDS